MWARLTCAWVVLLFVLSLSAPTQAHHSFNAEFDAGKTVVITGVLTKVEWINPHCFWWIQGKDQDGNEGLWSVQGFSPSELHLAGIKRDMAGKTGDQVTFEGYAAKDGTKLLAFGKTMKFADGRSVTMGVRDPTKDK
jgi:Family of unknown function (DUF6152)